MSTRYLTTDVTVVIPTIPPRKEMLQRAVNSVVNQSRPVAAIAISVDHKKVGAPYTRDRGIDMVQTPLVAFLDDDDELYPDHIRLLVNSMNIQEADLVYPWFDVIGGKDPFPKFEGMPWTNDWVHQVPVTFLAKTEAVRAVGCFSQDWDPDTNEVDEFGNRMGEDIRLIQRLVKAGYKIHHFNKRTWGWHHDSKNTSGRPDRW